MKATMNLHEQLENIKTQEGFTAFLIELQNDFKTNQKDWENWTIDSYLESIASCIKDNNWNPDDLDWKFLSKIFLSGKSYE